MTDVDDSLIEWLTGGALSEDFQYNIKEKELKKDFRFNKDKFSDINSQYRDFAQFQQTDEYVNTMKARELLSDQWDTNSDSLRETLMTTYKMSNYDCDQVMRNLGNSRDVECHKNNFNGIVRLRKKII